MPIRNCSKVMAVNRIVGPNKTITAEGVRDVYPSPQRSLLSIFEPVIGGAASDALGNKIPTCVMASRSPRSLAAETLRAFSRHCSASPRYSSTKRAIGIMMRGWPGLFPPES